MRVIDAAAISGTRLTKDGYLLADAKVSRTGIQEYAGSEVGRPEMAVVRVLRPEEEVFSDASMASFAHRPVTADHPPEMVTAANWRRYSRGQSGGEIVRDGDCLRIPLMVADADAIRDVQAGKRELSAGYTCDLDWTAGVTSDGAAYHARMTNLRGNHIAIVARGRAGAECRIGDAIADFTASPTEPKETRMKTILLDGLSIEVSDEGAAAIAKLQGSLSTATAATATATAALSARDGAMDALKATHATELAAANAKVLDAAALDVAITERTSLIDAAKVILGKDFVSTGKSNADIRRAAVAHKLTDAKLVGKDDSYVTAAFDMLTVTATAEVIDPARKAIIDNAPKQGEPSAYAKHVASLADAHLNPAASA